MGHFCLLPEMFEKKGQKSAKTSFTFNLFGPMDVNTLCVTNGNGVDEVISQDSVIRF